MDSFPLLEVKSWELVSKACFDCFSIINYSIAKAHYSDNHLQLFIGLFIAQLYSQFGQFVIFILRLLFRTLPLPSLPAEDNRYSGPAISH